MICYDFDLCSKCYDQLKSNVKPSQMSNSQNNHTSSHPMQCILTKTDQEIFYGSSGGEHTSFTCPYCAKLGLTEATLAEHINAQHTNNNSKLPEVVCPICAVLPGSSGGDPNHLTENLLIHINTEHLTKNDDVIISSGATGSNQSTAALRYSRRLNYTQNAARAALINVSSTTPGTTTTTTTTNTAPITSYRSNILNNRCTFTFGQGVSGSNPLSSFMRSTSSGLESLGSSATSPMDPIAELLSQLTGVRRVAATAHSTNLQLQQLQGQLNRERENLQQQQQLQHQTSTSSNTSSTTTNSATAAAAAATILVASQSASNTNPASRHHFHHHLFGGSTVGKTQLINSLSKNLANASTNQQTAANAAAQAAQTANNITNAFTNQILEIHGNVFLKPLPENCRDPRFLLSKYLILNPLF